MDLKLLPNKKFAFQCIQLMKEHGKLHEKNLEILVNADLCQRKFQCSSGFSVLQEVPIGTSDEDLTPYCCDGTGRQRYYKDIIVWNNKCYIITNHWYGPNKSMPDNRSPFEEWVNEQIK